MNQMQNYCSMDDLELFPFRNVKGRKVSLAVYVDDEANDLSDLGIGTSTASGKSSLSEDFDNNSVLVGVIVC